MFCSNFKDTGLFLELVSAGLWENCDFQGLRIKKQSNLDWEEVYRLATEQSVLGLVLAGIDYLPIDQRPPKVELLQWIGEIQMLEQQNQSMNLFIKGLVSNMRKEGIYTILVKGQGVAQCYERPLWRSCGDVDLLLSCDNYQKGKQFLLPLASSVEQESTRKLHQGMTINSWLVELHGNLPTDFSFRINVGINKVLDDIFYHGEIRSWCNDGVQVYLPSAINDVMIIFTHFLQHFYIGGVGLRQICDWCRLLYSYSNEIDRNILEDR